MIRGLFGSLSVKLFTFCFISISLLVLLLVAASQHYVSGQFASQQTSYVAHALKRTDYFLNQFMKNLQKDLQFIARDRRLAGLEPDETVQLLEQYRLQWKDIKNLYVFNSDGHVLGTSGALWEIASSENIRSVHLGLTAGDSPVVWTEPYFSPVSDYTVTVAVKIPMAEGESPAILAADLDLESILAAYEDEYLGSKESLLLLSRANRPISVRSPYVKYDVFAKSYSLSGLPADSLQHNVNAWQAEDEQGNPLHISRASSNIWGWQVILILNDSFLAKSLAFMKAFSILIGLAGLVLSIVVSYYLARYMIKPLKQLIPQMKKVSAGDFQTQIDSRRNDEFGILAVAFNRMVVKISQLMDSVVQAEIKKKMYELKVLQTQIQPHFLYNTLNSISYLAKRGRTQEVDTMITNLSSLLHFHLDKVEEFVPFDEELEGVKRYASIMEFRYPGQFILDFEIDEMVRHVPIPKFTLQPLVENAIFHGILPKGDLGSIVVTGERDGERLVLRVSDDGIGIPDNRRSLLLQTKPDGANAGYYHLGLFSIHERLRLYYGEGYGLRIHSVDSGGTTVEIIIPYKEGTQHAA
ncbi:sensor histidine kinase [Paenibacillus oceani]|uniref:Sensor histidine kinase n=1 Tax=Paenibacillus oceani TaxID=2772510 RepID=A0A927CGE4_9BACL|nr:sensor histidine kinase [Paenibacillus oceani]MBD2865731.1 sensor histidine kinase [Paenibacillus oceani]